MNAFRGIPILTAVLLLTACGSEQVSGGSGAGTPPPAADSTTSSAPPASTITVTDAAPPRAGGPCQPSQITLQAGLSDAAMGYREMVVTATNISRNPCVLNGFPTLKNYGPTGRRIALKPRPGALTSDQDVSTARRVVVLPGGHAEIRLGWRADLAAADVEKTTLITMTVTEGSAPQYVAAASRAITVDATSTPDSGIPTVTPSLTRAPQPIEIVDGTEIRIGGWRASAGTHTPPPNESGLPPAR